MATIRIYKVAELGMKTEQAITLLKQHEGVELTSASASIEEVVARQFVERMTSRSRAERAVKGMPALLLSASVVTLGGPTADGILVEGVNVYFWALLKELRRDPEFLMRLEWRKVEEIVAAAYEQTGWEVELTPASGDKGRDIIARRVDVGHIRILDQVKAYRAGHLVPANDVRALYGVLALDPNASKAVMTTTSKFAPGVHKEFGSYPNRLELRDGDQLVNWLLKVDSGAVASLP